MHTTTNPPRVYARIAGITYLLVIILGVVSAGVIDAGLIVSGDDAASVTNIMQNESLFRMSTLVSIILYAAVLVLSWWRTYIPTAP
ncbi:DUF4386 domain-containing protein [bacterium]|nr:DUF4386 domain-containing protein [bacterium]